MSTYEIEQAGRETIVGKLRAVGGATGYVPTQQANGELLQAPGGGSGPQQVTVEVSSAEILALHDTPVVLVPGVAGTVAVVTGIAFAYIAGATPYTDNGGIINVATLSVNWAGTVGEGFWDQATNQVFAIPYIAGQIGPGDLATYDGADIVLVEDTANPTDGDGTMIVTVAYFLAPVS